MRSLPLIAEKLDLRERDEKTSRTGDRKLIVILKQG